MKMKRVDSVNEQQLTLRNVSSASVFIVGLVFLAMGAGAYYYNFPAAEDAPPWLPQALGIGLMSLGGLMVLLRSGVVIDRAQMTVTSWYGPGFPLLRSVKRIEPLAVRLRKTVDYYRNMPIILYPIRVLNNGSFVQVGVVDDAMNAWTVAESVGTFLGVPVYDSTDDPGE